jgi:hypothetical protein
MVDENGEQLYLTNYNMTSSNNHARILVLHHELNIFYETLVVCGCLKCKVLKVNPWLVTLSQYVND